MFGLRHSRQSACSSSALSQLTFWMWAVTCFVPESYSISSLVTSVIACIMDTVVKEVSGYQAAASDGSFQRNVTIHHWQWHASRQFHGNVESLSTSDGSTDIINLSIIMTDHGIHYHCDNINVVWWYNFMSDMPTRTSLQTMPWLFLPWTACTDENGVLLISVCGSSTGIIS